MARCLCRRQLPVRDSVIEFFMPERSSGQGFIKRRVVVTGLGLVTPLGNTVGTTWAGLMAGKSGAGPITKFDAGNFPVRFACEVKNFNPLKYVEKKEARKMGAF